MVHFPLPFWLTRVQKIFLWLNRLRFTINRPELKSRLLQRYAIHRRSISFRTWNSKPIKTRLVNTSWWFQLFPQGMWNHHLGNMKVSFLICFLVDPKLWCQTFVLQWSKKWLRQIASKSRISVHLDVVLDCNFHHLKKSYLVAPIPMTCGCHVNLKLVSCGICQTGG